MDKLEPVIRHRFWILLGICLPLIIYGYMSASGAIQTATEERESKLETTYNEVPGGQLTNETWAEGLSRINNKYDLEVAMAHYGILEQQRQDMDWPPQLAEYLPDTYRGDFRDKNAGFVYMAEYEDLLLNTYLIAEPVIPEERGFSGKVYFPWDKMPRHEFGENELSISYERIWNAQEDLWFLRLLLQAVRDVNAGAENIAKARLRRIDKLELMGGDGQLGGPAATTGAFAEFADSEDMEAMMADAYEDYGGEFDDEGMDGDLEDRFGMGGASARVSVSFDPSEEFGNDIAAPTLSMDGDEPAGLRPTGISAKKGIRYIDFDESQTNVPYRERGFYMSVLIHQQYIPDFLITLSNSRWPIRIVRFHVGPNPHGGARPSAAANQYGYNQSGYDDEYSDYDDYEMNLDYDSYDSYDSGGYGAASPYGPQQNMASLAGAFIHPDLVQLEVLGAITLFNPLPEDVLAKVTAEMEAMSASSPVASPPLGDESLPAADTGAPENASPAAGDDAATQPSFDGDVTEPGAAEAAAPPS